LSPLALALLLFAAPPIEVDCYSGIYGQDAASPARLARIIAPRASFTPDATTARPGTKPYVVRGDIVLIGGEWNGYVPAMYLAGSGNGCLPATSVRPLPTPPTPKLGDWVGEWTGPGTAILTLKLRRGRLVADGQATWSNGPGIIHDGGINGNGTPNGAMMEIGGDCPSRMQLLGSYLIVSDFERCDGVNVTLSGVYTRRR